MDNKKNYPLHPGQTHVYPMYTQLPTEEYEALIREVNILRELTKGSRTTVDDISEIKTLTSEVNALREMNIKAQEENTKLKEENEKLRISQKNTRKTFRMVIKMELTKEFVKRCNKPSILRDFLLQAMDQVDALEAENRWHRCDKPNADGLYDLPPENGEYVVQYEYNGRKYVTLAKYDADYNDWNELCHGTNVIQWRELPLPKE